MNWSRHETHRRFIVACALSAGSASSLGPSGSEMQVSLEPRAAVLRVMGCRVDSGHGSGARLAKSQLCVWARERLSPAGRQYLAGLAAFQRRQAASPPDATLAR